MIDIKTAAPARRMALALLHHPFSVALSPKSLASHLDAAAFERAKAQAIKVPKFGQRLDTLPFLRHAGLLGEERSAAAVLDVLVTSPSGDHVYSAGGELQADGHQVARCLAARSCLAASALSAAPSSPSSSSS